MFCFFPGRYPVWAVHLYNVKKGINYKAKGKIAVKRFSNNIYA